MNYEFMVLDSSDRALVIDTAECLAESFTGVKVGDAVIQEPMSIVVNVTKEVHQEFTLQYLENVVDQGFCFIARDTSTGKVVGVLACEIYTPNEVPPVFEGNLAPINKIIDFLVELDRRFEDAVRMKTGAPMGENQYIHMFMIGVRVEKDKKLIGAELGRMAYEKASELGFKALFGEVTNLRSQMLAKSLGYYVPVDANKQLILKSYAEDEVFHVIPAEVATECMVIYQELDEAFSLRG